MVHKKEQMTALGPAVFYGKADILLELLERGAVVDEAIVLTKRSNFSNIPWGSLEIYEKTMLRSTLLQAAALCGYKCIILVLQDYGGNVNSPAHGRYSATALLAAVQSEHLDTIKLLIQKGRILTP